MDRQEKVSAKTEYAETLSPEMRQQYLDVLEKLIGNPPLRDLEDLKEMNRLILNKVEREERHNHRYFLSTIISFIYLFLVFLSSVGMLIKGEIAAGSIILGISLLCISVGLAVSILGRARMSTPNRGKPGAPRATNE